MAKIDDDNKKEIRWKLYLHGFTNENGSGVGVMVISPEGHKITVTVRFKFKALNNEAEYEGLIAELRLASNMKVENIVI